MSVATTPSTSNSSVPAVASACSASVSRVSEKPSRTPLRVRDSCRDLAAASIPSADSTPACTGTSARVMPSASASAQTCRPPAPPKDTSIYSRGSTPRCTEITRNACAMCSLASATIPNAACSTLNCSGTAICSTAASAAARSSTILPPRKASGCKRPSTRLASVTVACRPPCP